MEQKVIATVGGHQITEAEVEHSSTAFRENSRHMLHIRIFVNSVKNS